MVERRKEEGGGPDRCSHTAMKSSEISSNSVVSDHMPMLITCWNGKMNAERAMILNIL
jgi:hypothetical protein